LRGWAIRRGGRGGGRGEKRGSKSIPNPAGEKGRESHVSAAKEERTNERSWVRP